MNHLKMAGAFEDAFQKWLMKPKGDNSSSVKHAKQRESISSNRVPFPSSAPILVDDDEEQEAGEYFKNLETGPPVLEPVSHHSHAQNVFDVVDEDISKHSIFTAKQSDAPNKMYKALEKPFKTYSAYGNTHKSPQKKKKNENENQMELKTNSGNIFDKFTPTPNLYDDTPPPLIPSPKALAEDQQLSPQKEPVKSPDFCAMEADSTSELQSCCKSQEHSEKSGNGELPLECDSTCMLGGSPQIVSPASNSTIGEAEESRYSNDGFKQQRTVETQCNADSLDEKPNAISKPALLEKIASDCCSMEGLSDDVAKHSFLVNVDKDFRTLIEDKSVGVDFTSKNSDIGFSDSPPILTVSSHTAYQQHNRRKQRHTIDCAEGLSESKKANIKDSSLSGPPPLLLHGSESALIPIQNRPKGKKPKSSRSAKSKTGSNANRPCYKRSNTVPVSGDLSEDTMLFVRALWQLSQLQTRMHALISQLWPRLQLDLMTPESPQFCKLLTELVILLEGSDVKVKDEEQQRKPSSMLNNCMSNEPKTDDYTHHTSMESKQFNIEFSSQKKQHSQHESSVTLSVDLCDKPKSVMSSHQNPESIDNQNSSSFTEKSDLIGHSTPHLSTEDLPPVLSLACGSNSPLTQTEKPKQEQQNYSVKIECTSETSANLQKPPPCLSQNAISSSIPLSLPCDMECPLSGLSQLSLADGSELCPKPVSIVLPRDPDSLLASFSSLSCRALQLLLPEVAVSLTNELSCSPKALIAFIDNVLVLNISGNKASKKKSF